MKKIISIAALVALSCTSQKNVPAAQTDSIPATSTVVIDSNSNTQTSTTIPEKADTPAAKNIEETNTTSETNSARPKCIESLIAKFKADEVRNPPVKIYSYTYKGETVYYVPAQCCDFFSDLYDSNCQLIGHPDGGFTGRGDGKMKDFNEERKNEKLVWEDSRKFR